MCQTSISILYLKGIFSDVVGYQTSGSPTFTFQSDTKWQHFSVFYYLFFLSPLNTSLSPRFLCVYGKCCCHSFWNVSEYSRGAGSSESKLRSVTPGNTQSFKAKGRALSNESAWPQIPAEPTSSALSQSGVSGPLRIQRTVPWTVAMENLKGHAAAPAWTSVERNAKEDGFPRTLTRIVKDRNGEQFALKTRRKQDVGVVWWFAARVWGWWDMVRFSESLFLF